MTHARRKLTSRSALLAVPLDDPATEPFESRAELGWLAESDLDFGRDRSRGVSRGVEARGFALYVGVSDARAAGAGVDLRQLVDELRRYLADVPGTDTFASIVLAPDGTAGSDLEIVRRRLNEPTREPLRSRPERSGVVIDLARHRVAIDARPVHLSYQESLLLARLVSGQGRTLSREQLLTAITRGRHEDEIGERLIDVYVRRIRGRLEPYGEVIRTVRGHGYRFDPHPDVTVIRASAPSPDLL